MPLYFLSLPLHSLPFPALCPMWYFPLKGWFVLPAPSILPQDIQSMSQFATFLFQPFLLQHTHNNPHFCLWPYTASSPLHFFPSSLAMFPFFHFKREGKWAVTSVAGTRSSPVAREEPAPAGEAAKSLSQERTVTSPQQFLSAEKQNRFKSNLDID